MKYLLIIAIDILLIVSVFGQNNEFITLSTSSPRPIAMGGAFLSVQDNLATIRFNPGAFALYSEKVSDRITIFLNPVLPSIAILKSDKLGLKRYNITEKFINSISFLVKGITYSVGQFDFGLSFWEESILNKNTEQLFPNTDIQNYTYHSFIAKVKLAARISLGFSLNKYNQTVEGYERKGYISSYGVLMKPNPKIKIGIAYYDFPSYFNVTDKFYGIKDETVNMGISYYPVKGLILSMDGINLNTVNDQELRFGFEKTFSKYFATRGGFYRTDTFTKSKDRSIYWTCGIGLLNCNYFKPRMRRFIYDDFIINYTCVFERKDTGNTNWHFFNCIISF